MTNNNGLFSHTANKSCLSELTRDRYPLVAPWFAAIDGADICLASVADAGGGSVFVDDAAEPRAAWLAADDGFNYLAGDADAPGFADYVVRRLIEELLPARSPGDRQGILFSSDDSWKTRLDALLAPFGGFRIRRRTFAFEETAYRAACGMLPGLPEGYELRSLAGGRFDSGVFLGNEEAASCHAVFSGAGKVEIGIFTAEVHRRQGLALNVFAAFTDRCLAAGMEPHWSCWDFNTASLNLALRLGFRRLPDLEVNFCEL